MSLSHDASTRPYWQSS